MLTMPANDNAPFGAEFLKIPESFLLAYQNEMMAWAANLQARGPILDIDLWNPPGASVVSAGWQGRVRLRCDAMAHPVTKKIKFVIQPDSEADAERVAKHCEDLPAIMRAHKAAAAANRGTSRGRAKWVFDGTLPEYFILRYQSELRAWANNFQKIGLIKHIILREGTLSDLSPNEELGPVLIQVELKAAIERLKGDEMQIVASASTERDQMLIRKHCEKMQKIGISPVAQLVEPARAGIPFMPDKVN
jgi:hypothetical protein